MWNQRESGYSPAAAYTVCRKIHELHASLPHRDQMAYLHRIDNVLFSHGGLADSSVKRYVQGKPIGTQVFPVIDTEKGELSAELQTVGDQE